MNRELRNIESIRPRTEIIGFLTLFDIIFIVLILGVAYLIRGIVYPPFELIFLIGTAINILFLLKPSKNNPGKSHIAMMYLMIRRFVSGSHQPVKSIDVREYTS
ncbi:DUF5592 family protein [Vagococcus xieshaowenii]|uniref:Uncharacterized protein n=1 Tax=Vagococcus xieshaowenii TaxID=2562451 RepID=A0AAJ5JLV7_9ENTE|nr:DUF5592 family protein [Vagococcus xieshaowenii]QCA29683.1 hypothetical protein E4Z98_09865 [Vagococcus xieshaowenii]TFZ42958.1 hypothetical protein E4031_01605 [Vagococcus xieshaowenii]